jgi:hypothetical protein
MVPAAITMMRALWRSKDKRHRCQGVILFYGIIVFIGVGSTLAGVRLPWLLVPVVVTAAGTTVSFLLVPPIALMLASSEFSRIKLASQLQQRCAGFRVLFFLNAPSRGSTQAANLMQSQGETGSPLWLSFLDNNHWSDRGVWRDIVFQMMNLVPILIVDLRSHSNGLDEEIMRIQKMPALEQKTIFIGDGMSSVKRLQRLSSRTTVVNEARLGWEIFYRIRQSERKPPSERPGESRHLAAGWKAIVAIGSFFAMATASALYLYNRETSAAQDGVKVIESVSQGSFTVTDILICGLMVFLIGLIVVAIGYVAIRRSGHSDEELLEQSRNMENMGQFTQNIIISSDPVFRPALITMVGGIFCLVGVVAALVAVVKLLL